MEKFMYLFRGGDYAGLSPEGMEADRQKWFNWIGSLHTSGHFVAGEPLLASGKQVNGLNKTIIDGPFLESKELVGGYIVILAKNIEEALEISMNCPVFDLDGKLEIRPVRKMEI
jgi:hypothetical protein